MSTDKEKVTRKLRAILSADVKGYSLLMANDEAYTIKKLEAYRDSMSNLIRYHSGRVVDAVGDNLLAEFSSVVDAVRCAVEIQKDLQQKNADLSTDKRLEFRIGVNIGDVIQEGDQIYGNGVNVAARIEGLADAGGICISRNAYGQIRDKLELGYEYLGDHNVKNIKQPVRVYKVLMDPEDSGKLIGDDPKPVAKNWIWATAVLAAMIIIAVVWQFNQKMAEPEFEPARVEEMAYPLPEKPSIAVLAFDNMSGESNQDYLADGVSESIISALSSIPEMFVIARNSSFTYKGRAVKVQQISEELGVRYILEGSVLKSGDKIRIAAQLIDAITGGHVWSERYDREMHDLFSLLDEITQAVSVALQVELTHGEQANMWYRSTKNIEAWGNAVKGLDIFYHYTKEGNAKSRILFEQALEIDAEYSHALTMLAWTHFIDARFGYTNSRKDSFKYAVELAKKAVAMNENDPLVHSLWQHIYLLQQQHGKAIVEGRKAIALGPNDPEVHILFGEVLFRSGNFEEAANMCGKAIRLHPHTPLYYYAHAQNAYFWVGRLEDSLTFAELLIDKGQQMGVKTFEQWGLWNSIRIKVRQGRMIAAREDVARYLDINPGYNLELDRRYTFYKPDIIEKEHSYFRKAGFPEHPPGKEPPKPSIAVLSFDNLSDDPEQEYFSDGMTDDIITDLSKIEGLLVISRNSTFTYKGKEIKIPVIAKELGVKYVLEGSIRRDGDDVRINAQLIDAATDHHVWADRFDGNNKSIFELQDKITERIVSALAVKLSASEQKVTTEKGTNNIIAYDTFLKGMGHLRKFTPKDYVKAIKYFEKAIELDPNYSEAYASLATLYMNGLHIGEKFWKESGIDFPTARLLARYYVEKAMRKPTSRGYQVLARLELFKRNFNEAADNAEHAVAISPNDADALYTLGRIMVRTGQPEEGLKYHKKAIMLDPLYKSTGGIGYAYYTMGEYEQAVKYLEKQLKDYPETYAIRGALSAAYAFLGDDAKAEKAFKEFNT